MAKKQYIKLTNFKGVNRAISKRDSVEYLQTCENMDSNLEDGMLVSRKGSTVKQSSGATPNIDKFVMFRDEEWQKDVLLVYDKDATAADRKIYVYTRNINTDNSFAPHTTASYSYGSLRFGNQLTFLVHRNGVRIGTGTAETNKAMFAGYINRTADNSTGMFNNTIEFNDFFLLKQQWVQQSSLISRGTEMIYDSTREKYYILTRRGLEIRDSDFYLERTLTDVCTFLVSISGTNYQAGGLALTGNSLYAVGRDIDDSAALYDTQAVLYDLSNNYELSTSVTFDGGTSNEAYKITTDGTKVYITNTDGTDSFITEYSLTLGSAANRYTSAGNTHIIGITYDATYVYACDADTGDLVQMLKAAPYTSSTFATGVTPLYIAHYSGNLYWCSETVTYLTAVATFNSKTAKFTDTNQKNSGISFVSAIPYVAQEHRVVYFDGVTNFNEAGYVPTKISLGSQSVGTTTYTYFYAVSIVDIYGQETHLMRDFTINAPSLTSEPILKLYVNIDSENFAEMTSPSTDPAEELSVWNEFRRIKKFRIYRAYNENLNASEPTTNYNFLTEIDVNAADWTEVTANSLYTYIIDDTVSQTDISTVTYEESSGLPEDFKPYYTNWQYGINFQDRYYYGNVRTDEENTHEIIQTPINSPDVAYQHDQNIDYFYPGDGDEIKGFAQVWSRMVVFKGNNAAIYNELTKESVYPIGTSAPDSILIHNNVAYFIFGTGIYALTPSGYERISEPIDTLLAAESDLTGVSGVHFKEKQKLWWLVPSGDSYCYNYNKGTFDIYDIQSGTRDVVFVGQGLDDTIFTADQYDDKIYKENTGNNDGGAGNPIQISMITNDIALGDGYLDATITRLFLTSTSTDNISLKTYWRNRNGSSNVTKTFTKTSDLATTKKYVSSMWGQFIKFEITQNITAQVKIDAIGFEYFLAGELQDAS